MNEGNAAVALQQRSAMPIEMGRMGVELRSIEDAYRFAKYVVASRLAPKGLDSPEAVLVAVQMGAELGLPPMAAVQNVAVINGRPSIWGDAALAVCQAHPDFLDLEEEISEDGQTAVCKVYTRRRGMERPLVRRFSREDAKRAALLEKPGPWQQYPQRMLQMRARSWALRDAFPGALKGMLTTEEARDLPPRVEVDGEVVKEIRPTGPTGMDAAVAQYEERMEETTPGLEPSPEMAVMGAAPEATADGLFGEDLVPFEEPARKPSRSRRSS